MSRPAATKPFFKLYVVAHKPSTQQTIQGVRNALTTLLGDDQFKLEVFDVVDNPRSAFEGQIKATPTLVRAHPLPEVRIVGDMKNSDLLAQIVGSVGDPRKQEQVIGNS